MKSYLKVVYKQHWTPIKHDGTPYEMRYIDYKVYSWIYECCEIDWKLNSKYQEHKREKHGNKD